jgi:type IV pilus assembly protein PilC
MPTFNYKAKDRSGNTVSGTMDATDSKSAAGKIREMGYWPLDVNQGEEQSAPQTRHTAESFIAPIWSGVSVRSLALFFRQLATMIHAGMSLAECLDTLGKQHGMGKLPRIARIAADRVRSGELFSNVVADYPNSFRPMTVGLIRAAETGGMMDSMLDRIATYFERDLEIRGKFSRVTFYPKLLFVCILLIPKAPGIVLGGVPVLIVVALYYVLPLVVWGLIAYLVLRLLLLIPPIRYVWDVIKVSVPILGTVSRKLAMSRFSTALSVMYSAGLPISQALELSAGAMGNEVLRRAVLKSVPQIRAGGQLTDALRSSGQLPDLVMGMIATGEKTGSYEAVLDKVSDYYDTEAVATIEKFSYVLFAVLIIVAGIFVLVSVTGGYLNYAHQATDTRP